MKILHVINSMTVEAGGPSFVCAGLAKAQAALGHDVAIATVDMPGEKRLAVDPRIHMEYFLLKGTPRYAVAHGLGEWLNKTVPGIDFVHLHSVWQHPTFAAARACWRFHKPYVVLLNGMLEVYSVEHHNYWLKRLYWYFRERRVLSRAQGLHCLNRAEIRRAVDWIERLPKFVAGNGVSAEELAGIPPKNIFRAAHPEFRGDPIVLFLSRLHPKKGLERLIPVWQRVLERHPRARLLIAGAGDPPYVALLDRLIETTQMQSHIQRLGQLVGGEKWSALVDADVFVLPSHQEGFSMAITEAMAARCPVVVTQECNFDEVEAHDAGLIVRHGDMNAFADAVSAMLDDPAMRARCGANGQKLVAARYTWERVGEDMMEIYHWALRGKTFAIDGRDVWRRPSSTAHPGAAAVPKMRILHVIDTINPASGGPATVVSRLAAAQAALGHEVTILTYLNVDEQEIIARSLRGVPSIERVKLEFVPRVSKADQILALSVKPHLMRLIGEADMLHLHGVWEPLLAVAAAMARRSATPYVVRSCGMLDPWSLQQRWLKKRIALAFGYRHMLNKAAFIHALNRDEKQLMADLHLTSPVEVISNGVFWEEMDLLPPPGLLAAAYPNLSGKPYILFLSRLHQKKGLDYLADAFAIVARQHADVQLVVAGPDDGAAEPFLAQVERAGVRDRVHLVGPQYGADKLAILRDATLFCLPSRQEGFSLAITEALACGVPVVISQACHFPEVAESHAGLIVNLDAGEIAAALLEILRDPARRAVMKTNGSKLIRDYYTWPRVAEDLLAAYSRAIERRGIKLPEPEDHTANAGV